MSQQRSAHFKPYPEVTWPYPVGQLASASVTLHLEGYEHNSSHTSFQSQKGQLQLLRS